MAKEVQQEQNNLQSNQESAPPFFGSWKRLYLLVIANLVVLIVLFYILTANFS